MKDRILQAGITRKELAERLGVTTDAIYRWKGNPPKYAEVVLDLLIENRGLRSALAVLK